MTLSDLESGRAAIVKKVHGGFGLRRRLESVGVRPGGKVDIVRSGSLGGPVLLAVSGARVAIGQRQAQKVEVDLVDAR